ncbi:hypothetical protein [Shewanella xiamenensis]|uniref:hypothetical protein n=1 Tax=Shewanella xiamenensis TaxID=332186 RepID=UPI0015591585|nr:hypothetical protein [Shewanella xiamenensis]
MKLQYLPTLAVYFICSSSLYAADVQLGGFIKANTRFVEGNLAFQDSWAGGGKVVEHSKRTQFGAQESRFNLTLNTDEAKAFAEIDFVGSSQGNPIISNSYSPRLRHAYISYQGITAGQTWSTLVNTSTFAETADLGGPLVGQAMVRQALIRYSTEQWQFALENPYTYGTQAQTDGLTSVTAAKPNWIDTSHDYIPDMIARYNQSGEWGNVSISGLVRYLDPAGTSQWAGGLSLAAKLLTFGQDDLRLQLHYGHLGRYVGTDAARDIIEGELETSTSAMFAYRHFWTDYTRSTLFFGHTRTEREQTDRSHVGVNLFTNLTQALTLGIEVGRYQIEDNNSSAHPYAQQGMANYAQLSMQLQL